MTTNFYNRSKSKKNSSWSFFFQRCEAMFTWIKLIRSMNVWKIKDFYFIFNKFDNFFLPKEALMYCFLRIWQLWLRREMVHRSPVCLENWKQMLMAMAKSQISSLYSDFMRLSGSKNFPAIWSSSKSRIFQDWSLRSRSIYLYMCHLNHPQYLQRPKPKIPSAYWGKFEINTWKTSEALARLCKE